MLQAGVGAIRCVAGSSWAAGVPVCGVCDSVHARRGQKSEATRICNVQLEEATKVTPTERKERRGFASMSPDRQKEVASKGGRASHAKGSAHEWTPEEARSAGRKGGQVSRGGRGRLPSESAGADAPLQNE